MKKDKKEIENILQKRKQNQNEEMILEKNF
jgi:hypothetical protein